MTFNSTSSDILPVLFRREPTQVFFFPYHTQEGKGTDQREHPRGDETILQPIVGVPRRNGITEPETDRIADDDHGGHRFSADLFEAVNTR